MASVEVKETYLMTRPKYAPQDEACITIDHLDIASKKIREQSG